MGDNVKCLFNYGLSGAELRASQQQHWCVDEAPDLTL